MSVAVPSSPSRRLLLADHVWLRCAREQVQDADDPVSLACAYLALVPQALCVVYATLVLSTREAEIALAFAGQLACEALNFALKRLIKEGRPRRTHGKGYGMPSSHAQFVAFWSLSLALFLLVRHRPHRHAARRHPHRAWSWPERLLISLAAAALAALVAWSRIYLAYHTSRQVLVGTATGALSALAWFLATAYLRRSGWLAWALDTPLARAFRVRDLVVHEDTCQAGWEKWEETRLAKKTKAG